MPRTSAGPALALALLCGCAGPRAARLQDVTVGHHRVRFHLPGSWEHLDHGREQLFRLGEAQMTLADLGPATADGMASELEHARALWLAGRRLDAFARVSELRSPALRYASQEQRAGFWRPWTDVTAMASGPGAADSAAIGPAFAALIRGTRGFEPPAPERLYQYVADRALNARGQEIASRERRTIRGQGWAVYQLWNRVSHGDRTLVAFTVDDGYLLALTMDRGLFAQLEPAFESLLGSLEVEPAPSR